MLFTIQFVFIQCIRVKEEIRDVAKVCFVHGYKWM
jgi:hypothetical protein